MDGRYKVRTSKLYKSGEWFSISHMSSDQNITYDEMVHILSSMHKEGMLTKMLSSGNVSYKKTRTVGFIRLRVHTNEELGFNTAWVNQFRR